MRECGDAAYPDYAAGGVEEGREPVREHVVAEDICCEDLAQRRGGFFAAHREAFLFGQSADFGVLVCRPCGCLDDVGEHCPDCFGVVCACPAADASVPHDGVEFLASLEELLGERFDGDELSEVD